MCCPFRLWFCSLCTSSMCVHLQTCRRDWSLCRRTWTTPHETQGWLNTLVTSFVMPLIQIRLNCSSGFVIQAPQGPLMCTLKPHMYIHIHRWSFFFHFYTKNIFFHGFKLDWAELTVTEKTAAGHRLTQPIKERKLISDNGSTSVAGQARHSEQLDLLHLLHF